jgi:hypothetical protein
LVFFPIYLGKQQRQQEVLPTVDINGEPIFEFQINIGFPLANKTSLLLIKMPVAKAFLFI